MNLVLLSWQNEFVIVKRLWIQSFAASAGLRGKQPRSQGSLLPALSRSVGRVGENPGNEVESQDVLNRESCGRIHVRIFHFYPLDSAIGFPNIYQLDNAVQKLKTRASGN